MAAGDYYFVGQNAGQSAVPQSAPTFTTSGNGTAVSPAFNVNSQGGLYSPASGQLAVAQNGVQALLFSGSQQATFGGNAVLPAAGFLQYGSLTKVLAPADGTLQVTKSDGTFATLQLGPNTTGGFKFTLASGRLKMTFGDGTASPIFESGGLAINTADNNGALQIGSPTNGVFVTKLSPQFAYQVQDFATGTKPGYWQSGQLTVAKTSNYTLTFADMGVHFTNAGAAGTVQFTMPTPQAGYWARFTCTAAFVMTVVTPSGSIFGPGSLTGTTRTVTGTTPSAQYSSFDVYCYDGTNWVIRGVSGTIT